MMGKLSKKDMITVVLLLLHEWEDGFQIMDIKDIRRSCCSDQSNGLELKHKIRTEALNTS